VNQTDVSMHWKLLFWSGLSMLCILFWVGAVLVQQQWANPRAWGAFVLAVLIPYWILSGDLVGVTESE
jgi:hypothetical protein